MNTPTHFLVSLVLLGKPGDKARNLTLAFGSLLPDLSIFVLAFWAKWQGIAEREVWRVIYWQEPWQTLGAVSNSFPLYLLLLTIGYFWRHQLWAQFLMLLAASCLIHLMLDFPVHASDAHRHFWPLTDWRFVSPLSYWDRDHHGQWVSAAEFVTALVLIGFLWLKFTSVFMRVIFALLALTYIAVPAYFIYMMS